VTRDSSRGPGQISPSEEEANASTSCKLATGARGLVLILLARLQINCWVTVQDEANGARVLVHEAQRSDLAR
jgi:hypothetical protein